MTSGAYQALAEAAKESFSEPSYVVVKETVKQFPATGGVLAETSLNSTGSSVSTHSAMFKFGGLRYTSTLSKFS